MINFGSTGGFGTSTGVFGATTAATTNPMKDFEVASPPDDSISSLAFSPACLPQNFLIAGSWDNQVSIRIITEVFFVSLSNYPGFCSSILTCIFR